MKNIDRVRAPIQSAAAIVSNGYLAGFLRGRIYTGDTKMVCVPGLNCYSCPGALGACPIGAMQAVIGGRKHNFSYYTAGIIMLFGVIFGRFICGFLCPFGFIQDLLSRVPARKINVPRRADRPLRRLKYVVAALAVVLLPAFLTNEFGIAVPYFCKWICPAGTLEGGIPLVSFNADLRMNLGLLFGWKVSLMILTVVLSMIIFRPFCKYICPLGAFYSLFNKTSFYRMKVDGDKCTRCGKCVRVCEMNVEILKNINDAECIRCGKCESVCPWGAISSGFDPGEKKNICKAGK